MKKGTLVAVGVFAALLLLVLATREQQVSEGITKLELPGLDKEKLVALEISGPQSATLRKEGGAWVVLDPSKPDQKYPTDPAQVSAALDSLSQLKSSELVTERAEKHAEFEVDDAHGRKVRLLAESGPVAELIFGKAARSGTYVRKAGSNAVFVTSSRMAGMARWEPSAWRQRHFVGLKPEELAQVTVRPAGAEPYTLKAGDGGAWTLAEPAQPPAGFRFDGQAAQGMVQQLASLAAQDFSQGLSDDASGLAGAHDTIEAKLKDGKVVTLHLGAQAIPQDPQDVNLLKAQFDAVDATASKDSKITIEDLQKVAADASKSEDLKKLAARLAADPAAFARLDTGGYAGHAKDGAITQDDLDHAVRTLGLVPVRLDGDQQLYLVPAASAQTLRKKLGDLRDLSLLSFDPQKVTQFVIQAGGKKTVAVKDGGAWKITEPKKLPDGFAFDPGRVMTQLNRLRTLRATRSVEATINDAEAGLSKPSAVVEFSLEGGSSQSLRFGKEAPSTTGEHEVFVKGSVDSALYTVPQGESSRLNSGVEMFRTMPTPPAGAGQIQGLDSLPPELRKQIEEQLRARAHP